MSKCGCLSPEKRAVVSEVLDVYASILDDANKASVVTNIKKEIEECDCKPSKSSGGSDDGVGVKKKKKLSKYNEHTSKCMKEGKTMQECAVEWHNIKNEGKS